MPTKMQIEELQDVYVICRTIGHAWEDNPHAEVDSELFRASTGCLVLRCTRCATERFDYLGNDMAVFQRYYRYPEHYTTVAGTTGEPMRPKMRAEMFRRSLLIRKRPTRGKGQKVA